MLVDVIVVGMMKVTVMQVIDVAVMLDGLMSAVFAMHVVMGLVGVVTHDSTPDK